MRKYGLDIYFNNAILLKIDDRVSVRDYFSKNIKWKFGRIIEKCGTIHYRIRLDDGRIWLRHVDQNRKIGERIATSNFEGGNERNTTPMEIKSTIVRNLLKGWHLTFCGSRAIIREW